MRLRQATPDDVETLFEIRTSVKENWQSREALARLGVTPASVRQMLLTTCAAWLVEQDGDAIGFSMANRAEKTVFAVFVRPEYQGCGVGRLVLQAAEQWLASQGVLEAWLCTGSEPSLRSHGFYQHLGWTLTGYLDDRSGRQVRYVKRLAEAN